MPGQGCPVDGVDRVPDHRRAHPVPRLGKGCQRGPGLGGQVVGPDGVEDAERVLPAEGDYLAVNVHRAHVTVRGRQGGQLGPLAGRRVEALQMIVVGGGLEIAPADGVRVGPIRHRPQVITRERDAGGIVPALAVEHFGLLDVPHDLAAGPPAKNDELVTHHHRRAGRPRMMQRRTRDPVAILEDQHLVRGGRLQVRGRRQETTDQPQLILVGHQHRVMHRERQRRAVIPHVERRVVVLRLIRCLGRGLGRTGQATGQPDLAPIQHRRMQLLYRER